MKQALQLRIGQQLSMTPQMQQAIRLLQMSAVELRAEIQTALESNVMLEAVEDELVVETDTLDDVSDVEWEGPDYTLDWSSEPGGSGGADPAEWQQAVPEGLHEYLLWQIELTPFTDTDARIALTILDSIGDDGYLEASLDEIAAALPADCTAGPDEIQAVLHRFQRFDPVGVGARDLRECLLVQLGEKPADTPGLALAREVVAAHLDELGAGRFDRIAAACGVDDAALGPAIGLVRSLRPRPAVERADSDADFIVPDVLVTRRDGRWRVELNPETMPRLRINPYYQSLARDGTSGDDRACLREHLQDARFLLKSLRSRAQTLTRVADFIVRHQQDWLEHGDVAMRPLVLREVADALGMHESTISRVTSNKYLHTPRGVVEFRRFFSGQLGTADGSGASTTAARAQIRRLVADEDPRDPLSDARIAEALTRLGLRVARRTVAKYREAMQIPPASERKERRFECR